MTKETDDIKNAVHGALIIGFLFGLGLTYIAMKVFF